MARPTDRLPDPPPSLAGEPAAKLSSQTEAALSRQRSALAEALEESLEHIPRMLRGPVRRVLRL